MNNLAVYNHHVQKYIQGSVLSTKRKNEFIEMLKDKIHEAGERFTKLFPRKQAKVLDYIMYLVSDKGIWKVGAETIAKKVGCHVNTVYNAVESLRKTDEFIVEQLKDNHNGKYVFVFKSHPNFKEIMKEVFNIELVEAVTEEVAEIIPVEEAAETVGENESVGLSVGHFVGLENAEILDAVGLDEENQASKGFNSKNLKQEDLINTANAHNLEYFSASQMALYEFIKNNEQYHPRIRENAFKIVCRVPDTYVTGAVSQSLTETNRKLLKGEQVYSISAYVLSVYEERLHGFSRTKKENVVKRTIDKAVNKVTGNIPFFNWLDN